MDTEDKITKQYMPSILRCYRVKAGFSQQKLADSIGVSKSFVSFLESGKKAPSIDLLVVIADALGVKAGDMLNEMVERANNLRGYGGGGLGENKHLDLRLVLNYICIGIQFILGFFR